MALCTWVLWAVNCNWNGNGWNCNANSVDNPNEWNADNQVISRNYYFSSQLLRLGIFCLQPFLPPTNHSAEFLEMLRKNDVLLIIKDLHFP